VTTAKEVNMEQYIRRPLEEMDEGIFRILSERPIRDLLNEGCFLAGGSILAAAFGKWSPWDSIEDYLKVGDIDVFAADAASHERAAQRLRMIGYAVSPLGTAMNVKTQPSGYKLQLVTPRFSGSMEETLERFDIANCKVATDGRTLVYHRDVPQLEATRTLRLDKSPGFMLAWRVTKYMDRGYEALDPASHDFIVDWFIRLRTKEWDLEDASRKYFYSKAQVERFLADKRLVHDEDLLLAIGVMKMVVQVTGHRHTYDPNEEIVKDLAREELRRRLGLAHLSLPGDGEGDGL
jgi:hypothetical protein